MFPRRAAQLLTVLCVFVGVVHSLSSPIITTTTTTTTTPSGSSSSRSNIVHNVAVPGLQHGMDYVRLGESDLVVSKICQGTMTFGGDQCLSIQDGVDMLSHAFDEYGINFLDTAEMYPVPTNPKTCGKTDDTVAAFLKTRQRSDVIVATKVSGRSDRITWLRPHKEPTQVNAQQIRHSVDASLQRLGTDYIDLLQIHWPDRYTGGLFGAPDFEIDKYEQAPTPHSFEEQLSGLQQVVAEGKVRTIGLSNETPFGVFSFRNLAQQFPDLYPHIVSLQNSYSLCVRKDFDCGLAELCYHANVTLLAYSPLAVGMLTGKYRDPTTAAASGSRLTRYPGFMTRYVGSWNEKAVNAYCQVAEQHGLTPTQMALSWCYHNDRVGSTIVGATSLMQLQENLQAYDVRLDDGVVAEINAVYQQYTDPTKAR